MVLNQTAPPANMQELIVLPPSQRAAVILKSTEAELHLRELVVRTSAIANVVDKNGREEAHRAAMSLKNARVSIVNSGKAAREDATAFQRAVVAEVDRLVAITEEEETRLIKLRNDFDEKMAAEKAERERLDAERKATIRIKIEAITRQAAALAGASSADITAALADLAKIEATPEVFAEFTDEAAVAIETTASALLQLRNAARAREEAAAAAAKAAQEEKERLAAQAEAQKLEDARLAMERQRLDAERAETERLHEEQQKRAAQNIKAMDAIQVIQVLATTTGTAAEINDAIEAVAGHTINDETFGLGAGMVKMAQRMALEQLHQRYEQVAIAEEKAAEALADAAEAEPAPPMIDDSPETCAAPLVDMLQGDQDIVLAPVEVQQTAPAPRRVIPQPERPSDLDLVETISMRYEVPANVALSWLITVDIDRVRAALAGA